MRTRALGPALTGALLAASGSGNALFVFALPASVGEQTRRD